MTELTDNHDWLEIGTIVAAHGIQGDVKVLSSSDFPERFLIKGKRWVRKGATETPRLLQLKKGQPVPGKNLYILRFADITDRNQAETLIGQTLLIPETDRLPLEPGEYHIADLLGLGVYDHQSGDRLGVVTDFYSAGNDLLAVTLDRSPEKPVLIPFVDEIVPVVDINGDRLEIQPPPGLLDL